MRLWLGLLVVLLTSPARADTDPAGAKVAAKEAERLAAAKDYVGAAAKFRAAARLDPRPQYICNVGVAYQRAKQLPRAQLYLGECLRRGTTLDAKFMTLVRDALGSVENKLRAGDFAPIDIVVVPEGAAITFSAFDSDESFVGSRVVWLPLGKHSMDVTAEGYVSQQRAFAVHDRKQQQQRFELVRLPPSRELAPAAPALAATPVTAGSKGESPPRPAEVARSKLPPIVSTIATVAIGGAALATFVHAHSLMDSAAATTITRDEYDRRIDRAHTWQHASWGLAGVAGVGAIVTTLLWVRASHPTTIEVAPHGDGAAVTLSGAW